VPQRSNSHEVEHLKRETERSREELAQTVSQIRGVVSDATADISESIAPDAIKANIGDFVRTRGEDMLHTARQNPLQAAAVGAIAAYPVMALVRRIPAPLMMIGAGLFLMSSETGRALSQKAADGAGDLADQGRRMAHDWRDKSAEALTSVAEQASSVGASIRDAANEATGGARRYAEEMGSALEDGMAGSSQGMRSQGQNARDLGGNAINSLQRSTGAATDALTGWAQANPLLTAALGLAVGGLLASVLPVTRAETQLVESTGVRRRLSDAASQGVSAAAEAVSQIAERASEQGLTPQGVADASRDFGERALKVAEAAAGAALSPAGQQDNRQPPAGE
jgi:hypothetical protein